MTAVIAADFGDRAPRGRALVDAARVAGATWVVLRAGEDAAPLRGTIRAVADAGLGLVLRLDDTKALAGLGDVFGTHLGEQSVPALRDRLVVVVDSERAGKRLRTEVKWAPSAADLAGITRGLPGLLRRIAPNYVRALCLTDDIVVPDGFFDAARLAATVAKLRTRGGRVWVSGVAATDAAAAAAGPAFGVIVALE